MKARFFGQFLLERGMITADGLKRALARQHEQNKKLGELAVSEGFLTPVDASLINRIQRRTDARFGEAAIHAGLSLTPAQVESLLSRQGTDHVHIGEALVEIGGISMMTLASELQAYQEEQERLRLEIHRSKCAIAWTEHPAYGACVGMTSKLLMRVGNVLTKEGIPWEGINELPPAEVQVSITLSGDWQGDYVLRSSQALAAHIGSRMLDDAAPTQTALIDAMKEFANFVCGQTCALLVSTFGMSCELSVPLHHQPGDRLSFQGRKIAVFPLDIIFPPDSAEFIEVALIPLKAD